MENQDNSFVLHSFIQRKNFHVTERHHTVSNIHCRKDANEIEFYRSYSEESITIPNKHMKDFIMAAIESYCSFSPEFEDKEISITVTVNAK